MTEIPKEARAKAHTLMALWPHVAPESVVDNVARFIADVSEKAKRVHDICREALDDSELLRIACGEAVDVLPSLILPNPEDDLLKEAREIAKIGGYEQDDGVVQIIAHGIRRGKELRDA